VTATESGAPTDIVPPRSRGAADIYQGAFRRQLRAVAVGLLLLNLALGLFARQQQHAVIDHAIDIFDSAFISTNYLHLAQESFQHYADDRIHAADPNEIAQANGLLDNVLTQVDVAIERATSSQSREMGREIRERIAALPGAQGDPPALTDRIKSIQDALEQLSARSTSAGLAARDDIESFTFNSDLLLLGSIITSIMLAALALVVLNRLISSFKQRSSAQLSAALEGMPQGLGMFDGEQRLIVCNANYAAMYGLHAEHTVPGTPLRAILEHRVETGMSPVNVDNFVEAGLAASSSSPPGVLEQELQDGRIISVISAPLSTGGGVTIHIDVTEKRYSENRLAFLAHHDALTGLANRVQLRAHIEASLQQAAKSQRFSVLCLDLDQFKTINDTLGHPTGDALLRAVAGRLRDLVPDADLVARTGGDEFSIVLSNAEPASAANLAARAVEALGVPFDLGDHQVVIGASVGIAIAPDDGNDADQLLKNADMALYRAKDDGRGRFHFFEIDMDARAQARRILELDLRKAIGIGEFELFYQPIVNLEENRISGFEALLR
jgi:diguanylate cyclase (GGDEF)-like protein